MRLSTHVVVGTLRSLELLYFVLEPSGYHYLVSEDDEKRGMLAPDSCRKNSPEQVG